mgnify:CR=1 FL=1
MVLRIIEVQDFDFGQADFWYNALVWNHSYPVTTEQNNRSALTDGIQIVDTAIG